jgi:hypothetical protein
LKRIGIVLNRDFKELRKTGAFILITVLFTIITIAASVLIVVLLRRQISQGNEFIKPVLELIISLVAYFLPLSIIMTFIWAFSNLTIIQEKIRGNVESLLATPLNPTEIWIAKSLAIFLPGYLMSVISTIVVLASVNFFVAIPFTGNFIMPIPLVITNFIANPLLFLGLLLFVVLFSLTNNPDIAITPTFLVGFGLMIGIPLGVAMGKIDLASWIFALFTVGGAVVFFAVDLGLYHLLTKENIVLSGKGN